MSDQTATPVPGKATETPNTTNNVPVKGNWGEKKDKLKAQFPTLTDADLRYEKGKKDEMLTNVQVKLGKTKEELDTIIAGL